MSISKGASSRGGGTSNVGSSAAAGAETTGSTAAASDRGGGGGDVDTEYAGSWDEGGMSMTTKGGSHRGEDSSDMSLEESSSTAILGGCSDGNQVVEHSPQGRYVRFNHRTESNAYKEVWKAYDTSEGVEVAWSTLCLDDIPRTDKKRILNEINILEKVSKHVSLSTWIRLTD